MTLTLQLPPVDPVLKPNSRSHRSLRWKAVKAARETAATEARRVLADAKMEPPHWRKARYTATLYMVGRMKQPDPGNFIASLKPYEDGIEDAGIIWDDKELWPERPKFIHVERMPRIEIAITPEL